MLTGATVQAPCPLQVPSVPQVVFVAAHLESVALDALLLHVPWPFRLHAWQVPHEALPQQTPSTQKPVPHCAFPEQGLPEPRVGVQAPPDPQ